MKTIHLDNKAQIEAIIEKCEICYVGMVDEQHIPYVIPMCFGYRNGTIYLHSGPAGRSIGIINKNNLVCITFNTGHELVCQNTTVACSYRMKSASILCYGHVSFVESIKEKKEILNIILHHYTGKEFEYGEAAAKNVKIWKIPVEKLSAREYGVPYKQSGI